MDVKYHDRRRQLKKSDFFFSLELCEQGGEFGLSFLIPFFPPSPISRTVSVDVKYHERRRQLKTTEPWSCVNREVNLGSHSLTHSSPSPINSTVSVDIKHHGRNKQMVAGWQDWTDRRIV